MKNYQSINLVKTLTNKECLHKTYIPTEYSKTIVINDNCLISESVYECKECGSIFSLYEIRNDHLKSFKDEFLSNIPPLFKESREQKADRFFKDESYQKAFLE